MPVTKRNVNSLAKSGSAKLKGDVTLSEGSNVTLTQSGNDISIAASGTGGGGTGDMLAATYDPNTIASDAFAMDNMEQGATKKYVSATDITNLGNLSGTNTGDQTSVTGNAGTATKLATARNIDGQSFDGSADITVIAPGTHAATSKTTPVDADELPIVDSAASNVLKKLTWANLKAAIKSYYDSVSTTMTNKTLTSPTLNSPVINTAAYLPVDTEFFGATSGHTTVSAVAVASGTLTLPATTDTLVGKATTDTLTNKTLTAPKFADTGYIADDSGNELLVFHKEASAVNQFAIKNAAASSDLTLSVEGSDTNISPIIKGKGNGALDIQDGSGNHVATHQGTGGTPVNYLQFKNSDTGTALPITALGSDTNISVNVVPKGTGRLQSGGVNVPTISSTDTLTNKTLTTPVIDQFGSASGLGAAWSTYTPTIANFTLGNGTSRWHYYQIGKFVYVQGRVILGSTSSVSGVITISLPQTAISSVYQSREPIGTGIAFHNASSGYYPCIVTYNSTTTVHLTVITTQSGSNPVFTDMQSSRDVSNGTPFGSAGTSDVYSASFCYEAA